MVVVVFPTVHVIPITKGLCLLITNFAIFDSKIRIYFFNIIYLINYNFFGSIFDYSICISNCQFYRIFSWQ